jgi:hypothetical protein
MIDLYVSGRMGFYLVHLNTEAAADWWVCNGEANNLDEYPCAGYSFPVDDTRLVSEICRGALTDGLTVASDNGELEIVNGELVIKPVFEGSESRPRNKER